MFFPRLQNSARVFVDKTYTYVIVRPQSSSKSAFVTSDRTESAFLIVSHNDRIYTNSSRGYYYEFRLPFGAATNRGRL